jgi:hypothetical protein
VVITRELPKAWRTHCDELEKRALTLSTRSYHTLRLYDDEMDVTIPLAESHEWFTEANTAKGNLYYEEVWLIIDPSTIHGVTRVMQRVPTKGLRGQPRSFYFGAKKELEHVCYLEPQHLATHLATLSLVTKAPHLANALPSTHLLLCDGEGNSKVLEFGPVHVDGCRLDGTCEAVIRRGQWSFMTDIFHEGSD